MLRVEMQFISVRLCSPAASKGAIVFVMTVVMPKRDRGGKVLSEHLGVVQSDHVNAMSPPER